MADRHGRARPHHSNGHHRGKTTRPPAPAPAGLSILASSQAALAAKLLRERGQQLLDQPKASAARHLAHIGTAIQRAADTLEDRDSPSVARYISAAAERVDAAARYLDRHDLTEVTREVGELARRRPTVAFAGLFLVGVAAARLMRVARSPTFDIDDPDSGTLRRGRSRH